MKDDNNNDTLEGPAPNTTPAPLGVVILINKFVAKDLLDKLVIKAEEKTLNGLLDAEADQLCEAKSYEHSPDRADTRAGHYECQLHTKAGEVTLRVPKLRTLPSRLRSSSVKNAASALSKKRLLRCTSPAFPCSGLRTSPRRSGVPRISPRRWAN